MTTPNQDDLIERFRLVAAVHDGQTYQEGVTRNKRCTRIWRRQRSLGSGAYGTVWLEQRRSGKQRAIKMLKKDNKLIYLEEIRAMAKLSKVCLHILALAASFCKTPGQHGWISDIELAWGALCQVLRLVWVPNARLPCHGVLWEWHSSWLSDSKK